MQEVYITIESDGSRETTRADMPTVAPDPANYEQQFELQDPSGKYLIKLFTKGIRYDDQAVIKLVTILLTEPITRYGMIKPRIVVLDEDLQYNCMLIISHDQEPAYTIIQAQGTAEGVQLDPNPIQAERRDYPLPGLFEYWRAAGYKINELPGDASNPSSHMYAVVHESSGVDWQTFARAVMQWIASHD